MRRTAPAEPGDLTRTSAVVQAAFAAFLVVCAGLLLPGGGIVLAVILSFTFFRGRRATQILLGVLGVLMLALSVSALVLPVHTELHVDPPVLVDGN